MLTCMCVSEPKTKAIPTSCLSVATGDQYREGNKFTIFQYNHRPLGQLDYREVSRRIPVATLAYFVRTLLAATLRRLC